MCSLHSGVQFGDIEGVGIPQKEDAYKGTLCIHNYLLEVVLQVLCWRRLELTIFVMCDSEHISIFVPVHGGTQPGERVRSVYRLWRNTTWGEGEECLQVMEEHNLGRG